MRRTKAELHKYIDNAQSSVSSPREKAMKGFLFAKLYYEAKEYDLAKRCVSSYIDVQARDPKAHRFLGHLFEIEENIDKAVGCYKRSLELNPTQKDLVLRIAELICTNDVTDGRAEYWVEKAAKLFPGNPVIYRLKEQLLNTQGEAGWNQLFDLIQSELFARPNDVFVNIRLVELFRSSKRLDEAVIHCLKPERRVLRTHLEWCSCVVEVLKEYLSSNTASAKSNWRTINKELLIALGDLVLVTLSTRDVQESRIALKSFDQALLSVKPQADGTDDDLSVMFAEMRGHYYMHAGTLLLKMAQHNDVQWKASLEPAALCYLLAFQVPWNKPIKRDENVQNILEGLACDRQSQSGHLLLSLSHGKDNFLQEVIETFANINGQSSLLQMLFENDLPMEQSFLGTDNISNISGQIPDLNELHRYDHGAIRIHNGDLQHLTWLGLQWHFMFSFPSFRKWLKQLFPRVPQETSKLESNNPESICILDLEVFLLAVIYTSHLQLQNNYTSNDRHQPRCLPLPICKQLFTDKQKSWWDAVYSLIHKTAQPGSSAKLRLVIQHELNTLRALEKHGLQPALLIHWARSLSTTGNSLNSFYDQRDYAVRCIHYWKRVLPQLELIRQKKSIPEPVDPLFKHFHCKDIKLSEVRDLEDEAGIAFAKMDIFDGKTDDAILALEAIKNVDSYWNLALVYQRKGDDIENDVSSEEQIEYRNYMQKCKFYLLKILDEVAADPSLMAKLPVPIESVEELLDEVRRNLDEAPESQSPNFRDTQSFMAASGIKHSTPSPSKFTPSPSKTPKSSSKTPPRWAEDQKTLIEDLVQQVEALKKEVHELRMNNSNSNMSSQRWAAEGYTSDAATDGYHLPQGYYDVPLTVSTTAHPSYYVQSPVYNPQQLLRPVANVTPTKTPVYPVNRMANQQHMYAMHTPPVQSTAMCGHPLRFESPATNILSPQTDEYYNYNLPQNTANPTLPEPGYFTKAALGAQPGKSEFGKTNFVQPIQSEGPKSSSPFTAPLQSTPTFKFNSNFKSNDGDFTFSANQGGTPAGTGSECLLRLLTSDKPISDQGIKPSTFETNPDSRNMFRFGEKNVLGNLADGSNQLQDKSSTSFGQSDMFSFQSSAKSTFVPPTKEHNKSHESDVGSEYVPEEDGPHFEPVVPLPEKIEVKTGEEEEEEMFCNRAKLFRFDTDTKEWKERGVGNVKILRHPVSGKIRLLMRREQVLKICANHLITSDMKLKPLASSDKSFVWHAYDYADEMPKSEQLAIRFKTPDEAALFKTKFEAAQKLLQAADSCANVAKPKVESVKTGVATPQTFSFRSQFGSSAKDAKIVNPGKNSVSMSASAFTFSKDALNGKPLPAEQPMKSKDQWICGKCSTMNDTANNQCVRCHPPNQSGSGSKSLNSNTSFKNTTASQGTSFGSAFVKKSGQWDCDVCLVRNEPSATNCAACQTPNPASAQAAATSASSFKFVAPESSLQKDFGGLFAKKDGQWDCSTCLVRNEAIVSKCVSCQSPKPQQQASNLSGQFQTSGSTLSRSQKENLESMFSRKEGQWDCDVCLVRNEPSAANCVACQTPNPASAQAAATSASSFKFVAPESSLQKDLGSLFAKKEGQWDCSTCLIRNEASVSKCVSCESPKPQQQTSQSQTSGSTFGNSQNGNLESMFSRKEGQWDCTVCLVRNDASASTCVACQAPNPNKKNDTAATETKPAYSFGFKASSSGSFGPPSTGFKCNFPGTDFKFGTTDDKLSVKAPSSNENATPSKEGFSFKMPFSSTSFKFGTSEPNKVEQVKETAPLSKASLIVDKDVPSSETKVHPGESEKKQSGEVFANSFSFADLAESSQGFAFGKKDPNFKGFSGAGEKLFVSKSDQANTSADPEAIEELYKTEDRDDIHFEPVVQLPDKVELVTGEEDEKVLYCQRLKLYRFDTDSSQWKERGVGLLKILKNEVNGKLRILMRREQVLKVCANHWITTTMHLKPLSGSDRSWIWLANDFSDGDAKLEQLAAKFKTPEQAEEFKNKFEECQRLLLDIPLQTPHKLVDTGRTAQLIKKAEEMKTGLKDLKTFLTDQSKPEGDSILGTSQSLIKKTSEFTEPTYEWDTYDIRASSLEGNLDDSIYASPLAESPEKSNLFRFGESTVGFNFSFQPSPSPAKSPTKLNQSRTSVGTDEESDVTQEEERDGQYFEPVVPLPDLIEVTSGEENEQALFFHRAKLYRFDKDSNQWKERGIGDLKILQNFDSKVVRIVMRRDQVLKLCANHRITPDIHMEPMKGAERAWVWTAPDFAETDGKVELFAVRFKHQEVADLFKEVFEEAKSAQSKESLLSPFSARVTTPKASPCGKAAVAILEETTKEKTSLPAVTTPVSGAHSNTPGSSEKTPKNVVSPPKFVFGSEVVKNIFGTEKKAFTFGNSSGAGTLFGFSFNPSKTQHEEEDAQSSQPTTGNQEAKSSNSIKSTSELSLKPSEQMVLQNPVVSSTASSTLPLQTPARAKSSSTLEADSSSDVVIVYELIPTAEQRALADKLLLPLTFFCYKDKPGYVSDESDVDDEDFETAVKNLKGQLYQDDKKAEGQRIRHAKEKECVIVWEKTPTPEERAKAESLKLPPTFFCGVSSDTDEDKETAEDYESAVKKVSDESKKPDTDIKPDQTSISSNAITETPVSSTTSTQEPVDLSSKTEPAKSSSESQALSFTLGLNVTSGLSFADLATNNGDFAFGAKEANFQWANTGAAVFSSGAATRKTEKGGDSDDDVVHSDDVHFEPIVSLPEVEVKSGEEDEEILFKERSKLYRWDRDANQWKERGVGEIKILYHQERNYYRILMRRDQVLKVCANHVISKDMKLAPLNTSQNSFVWIANDYSDGEGTVEQFAVRFKTQELADSFQRKFEECQSNLQSSDS